MGNRSSADADPDTAWKAQNREQQENLLYRYVNLKQGGELIRVYEKEGPAALERFVRQEVELLLYNGGQGDTINKLDWIRFQAKCNARLKGSPLDDIDRTDDSRLEMEYGDCEQAFTPFEEHEACWRLDCRGSMGETAMHLLCLQNSPTHAEIAKLLLKMYPKMALDIYEGDEYYGETALHLAISNGDQALVRILVENGADVNRRATGRFFLPEDQKKIKKSKMTNYEGFAYYGEYPLAFAACFGHEEIYDYLIDHGADPNVQDSFGNTVLHMLVINNKINMFNYAVKHHSKRATMDIQNGATLTPLTLASKLGRHLIFKEIIELQSFEVWRYSNITCSCYPLAPLDTIGVGGGTNWSSVLIYMTDGKTDEHLEMLEGGVIKQLLDEKWKTFAQRRFFERFAVTAVYLIILSIAVYLRPPENLLGPVDARNIVRYMAEIFVVLYVFLQLCFQFDEMRLQGVQVFFKNQLQAPAKSVFNISCILLMLAVPFRFVKMEDVENVFVALACPMSWFFLLFFLRGHGVFGPFVIMIYQMTATDMIRFFIIFFIFMAQFTQGGSG